jgi:hypothetical protein
VEGTGLVKVKVPGQLGIAEVGAKEIESLQHIGLLDKARTKDAVPAPMLIDGPFGQA